MCYSKGRLNSNFENCDIAMRAILNCLKHFEGIIDVVWNGKWNKGFHSTSGWTLKMFVHLGVFQLLSGREENRRWWYSTRGGWDTDGGCFSKASTEGKSRSHRAFTPSRALLPGPVTRISSHNPTGSLLSQMRKLRHRKGDHLTLVFLGSGPSFELKLLHSRKCQDKLGERVARPSSQDWRARNSSSLPLCRLPDSKSLESQREMKWRVLGHAAG